MRSASPTLPIAAAIMALALTSCSTAPATGGATTAPSKGAPVAVATTTQIGSVLSDITTCAGTTSTTLMPAGTDPHEFALSSAQASEMSKAKLVVANGLSLEGGMKSTLDSLQKDGVKVYNIAPDLDPQKLAEEPEGEKAAGEHEEEHDPSGLDPHVFMDMSRMAKASINIGNQLKDATGDDKYVACAKTESDKIMAADAEIRSTMAAIPAQNRVLVTDHDALGYFASAYGFKVAAVVVPGGSTDAQPSSAELEKVVGAVKSSGVHAIFSNTAVSPKLVESVGAEAGGVKVVPLYVDSVGPAGSGADTYIGMMKADAQAITDALK